MSYFLKNPITNEELIFWNNNKNINPRTKRSIKTNGTIYRYLQKEFSKNNDLQSSVKYDITQVTINQEPITLDTLYDERTKKSLVNQNEYIIYKDNNHILALHYTSLLGLQNAKIFKHPLTRNDIPKNLFKIAEEYAIKFNYKINNNLSLNDLGLKAFQYFNNLTIFINHEDFLKINENKCKKLCFELKSFFDNNLTIKQKKQFKKLSFFEKYSHKDILNEIIFLMENVKEQDKLFVSYLILGGLVLVMPKLKKEYPFLEYSFNTNNV